MSGRWDHAICDGCWKKREPGRDPVRLKLMQCETCCFCGSPTVDGIFVREDPQKALCHGAHEGESP